MSEEIRSMMTAAQWQITKGHIRSSVDLRGQMRMSVPPKYADNRRYSEWLRFRKLAEDFMELVESEGWGE